MINSLIKGKKNQTISRSQRISQSLFINDKPMIYEIVEQEILRNKMMNFLQDKTNFLIRKKYFNKLKFHFKFGKFRKKMKKIQKRKIFNFLIKIYFLSKRKEKKILMNMKNFRKLILFYNFIKCTKISILKKIFLIKFISKNFKNFISEVKCRIEERQNILMKKIIFYLSIGLRRFKEFAQKSKSAQLKKFYFNKQVFIRNNFLRFFEKFTNFTQYKIISKKIFYLTRKFFFQMFLSISNRNLENSKNFSKLILFHNKRNFFLQLKLKMKIFKNLRNQITIIKNYQNEKKKSKIFQFLKHKHILTKKFKSIICKKFSQIKEKFKIGIISMNKKLFPLKFLYKNFKLLHNKKFKEEFFISVKSKLQIKRKIQIVSNYYKDTSCKKIFSLLQKTFCKTKFFKIFLKMFHQTHNEILKINFLNILRFKCKKIKIDPLIKHPHIINYYNEKNKKKKFIYLNLKRMKNFFKKCKKSTKSRINLTNKMKISEFFYNQKLLLKFISGLNVLRNFLKIKQKKKIFYKKKFFELIEGRKNNEDKLELIKFKMKKMILNKYLSRILCMICFNSISEGNESRILTKKNFDKNVCEYLKIFIKVHKREENLLKNNALKQKKRKVLFLLFVFTLIQKILAKKIFKCKIFLKKIKFEIIFTIRFTRKDETNYFSQKGFTLQ